MKKKISIRQQLKQSRSANQELAEALAQAQAGFRVSVSTSQLYKNDLDNALKQIDQLKAEIDVFNYIVTMMITGDKNERTESRTVTACKQNDAEILRFKDRIQ